MPGTSRHRASKRKVIREEILNIAIPLSSCENDEHAIFHRAFVDITSGKEGG
jgi:hypothetical protein